MKIIKQGQYDGPETKVHRFSCSRCGCIWEAAPGEFYVTQHDGRTVIDIYYECPTCGKICLADN